MSNSKGSILISNANAVGTALVNKLGGTGYTPNEWSDKINLLGIADADIPTALAGITEGSYTGEDRGAIKICNANNVGTMLNKKFNTNRGFKPSEWESAISKLTALTTGTASGSVVTFSDGADDVPLTKCEVTLQASLNGYSEVDIHHTGSNLWDEEWELGAINVVNGQNVENNNFIRSTNYIPVSPNTTYYKCAPQNYLQLYYGKDKTYLSYGSWNKNTTFTTPANCYFVRFYVAQEYGTTYNNDIALNYPSTVTEYAHYSGTTHTANLGRTIYGGKPDVVKGEGTESYGIITFDGSNDENWQDYSSYNGYYIAIPTMKVGTRQDGVSNYLTNSETSAHTQNTYWLGVNSNRLFLIEVYNMMGSSIEALRSYLSERPLTVVFPLATPTDFTFDPIPINSKKGNNTIWSDGDTSVTYYKGV